MRSIRKINEWELKIFSFEDLQIEAGNEFSSQRLWRWVSNLLLSFYLFFISLHHLTTNKLTIDIDSVSAGSGNFIAGVVFSCQVYFLLFMYIVSSFLFFLHKKQTKGSIHLFHYVVSLDENNSQKDAGSNIEFDERLLVLFHSHLFRCNKSAYTSSPWSPRFLEISTITYFSHRINTVCTWLLDHLDTIAF